MDKNAIKKYAVWARRELISRVSRKALQYGISAKETVDAAADSVNGKLLTDTEKQQRQALVAQINEKGFEQVVEEVAYTWFNRFSALRFMEVNGYLPTHVRVFTDEENNFKPQIITEAIHLEMDGLDMDKVYTYKEADQTEELYKYLLITQCNALNKILPGMFQRIADYTELLFPDNLLREGSVIEQMIAMVSEEDWQNAVQIIGWLYQYYNSEPKDTVFANLKKNIKISKEDIPAATQLFTPDWIVRYMVENSLGRLWLEGHPNDGLKAGWKYYLDEAEQEAEVQAQLAKIREEYQKIKPEEIRCIDPCMGSGHILVYMFDVLMQIYEAYGYNQREAASSIVENNLFGLDIDDRAAQLAYFAVMMKARQYDRRFFSRDVQPHVYAIRESNNLDPFCVDYFVNGDAKLKSAMSTIIEELHDAKEYGSILTVSQKDFSALYARFDEIRSDIHISRELVLNKILPLVQVAEAMVQKYHVVVTNPPYMGSGNMSKNLSSYLKKNYKNTKMDLSTVFMEKTMRMCLERGFMAMINIPVWMFISSFEELREYIVSDRELINMLHFGRGIFGSDFGTTAFVIENFNTNGYIGRYQKLYSRQGAVDSIEEKEQWFFEGKNTYYAKQDLFSEVPGTPISYWISKNFRKNFIRFPALQDCCAVKNGLGTMDNDKFLRFWYEVVPDRIAFNAKSRDNFYKLKKKWAPYNKGGSARKWYGNRELVVNWENDGAEIRELAKGATGGRIVSVEYYFHESISWSYISQGRFAVRYFPTGTIFDSIGTSCFPNNAEELYDYLGVLNSKVITEYLNLLAPTLAFNPGSVGKAPINIVSGASMRAEFCQLVNDNIKISRADWDSFEISWDYIRHPLVEDYPTIRCAYEAWRALCDQRYNRLITNEREINRICISNYGLESEITPEVDVNSVAIYLSDIKQDIKNLISYAVGCMFGRYSLDVEGLAYAGGDWDDSKYKTFPADTDNIIPICDDEYFPDDIVGRFVKFIETVYGTDTLEENLQFIAAALGGKATPREVIRNYFINDFYADHCKMYQKRPIYWLFDSGKKNGFKALIYLHRYQPDTLARMRTDYVHEQQARYRTAIENLEQRINGAATADRVKLNKQLTKLREQAEELRLYEEKIHHLADRMIRIDLDDGVKHNYEIFKDVLANIK